MVTRTKQLRLLAIGLAVALTLVAAGPAAAMPPAWDGGWLTSGIDQVASWWTAVWGSPGTIRAANEVLPNIDPDGATEDPDGATLLDGEATGETEASPHIDPDG